MRGTRFSETQIVGILNEVDAGMPVKEICRKYGDQRLGVLQLEEEIRWVGGF